jgi:U3 small nucleolar RNA-associated protein 21
VEDPTPLAEVGAALPLLFDAQEEGGKEQAGVSSTEGVEEHKAPAVEDGRQKAPGLATLAMLPRAHWQTLFSLELIKERNKPKEPPKAPPRAPFFLPTLHPDGVNPAFAPPPAANTQAPAESQGAPQVRTPHHIAPGLLSTTQRSTQGYAGRLEGPPLPCCVT